MLLQDKLVESSSKMNMAAAFLQNVASYPPLMHHTDQGEPMPFEGEFFTFFEKHPCFMFHLFVFSALTSGSY